MDNQTRLKSSKILFSCGVACMLLLSACGSETVSRSGGKSSSKANDGYGKASPYGGTSKPKRVLLGKPYTIKGKRYYPKFDNDYSQVGIASWYGPGFHGRKTANGERYNQYAMTAAHTTLPMPSIVKVTRLDNGKSIIVRVNDRGPFAPGRIIDLSKEAASRLGTIKSGVKKVRVDYLPYETEKYIASLGLKKPSWWKGRGGNYPIAVASKRNDAYSPAAAKRTSPAVRISDVKRRKAPRVNISYDGSNSVRNYDRYRVQTATFSSFSNAQRHASYVGSVATPRVEQISRNGAPAYKVMLGPVRDASDANKILNEVKNLGFADARILVE